jgi:hypothetical protein
MNSHEGYTPLVTVKELPGNLITLQDHFRPPLSSRRHWHAFHNAWATYIASSLNAELPAGYFAEPNVRFGIEIDVATFEEAPAQGLSAGAVAICPATYVAPIPTMTVPFSPPTETVEVLIFESGSGPTLAGAVELVSPANKDRAAHRDAFISKCQTYLHMGAGLAIVDVVTDRSADLHRELLDRIMGRRSEIHGDLHATAYHPVERHGKTQIDVWEYGLAVRAPLPVIPLWLRGELCLPLDLPGTYDRTCREQRLPIAS